VQGEHESFIPKQFSIRLARAGLMKNDDDNDDDDGGGEEEEEGEDKETKRKKKKKKMEEERAHTWSIFLGLRTLLRCS
jgi:hypothetical protein